MEAIAEGKKEFRRFRKKAFLITGKNADSGDPFQLLMSYVRMVFHVDILAYNSLLKEIKDKADTIMLLIDNIGELDALVSIASFRRTLSLWSIPVFMPWSEESDIAIQLKIEDLYHPLIRNPVANSITATGGTLVTGSNASGKSTFLKKYSCTDHPHLYSHILSDTVSESNDFHGAAGRYQQRRKLFHCRNPVSETDPG